MRSAVRPSGAVELTVRGTVEPGDRQMAVERVTAVLTRHDLAADGTRLRLTGANCAGGPMVVQVNLRVFGAPARIQVGGSDPGNASATAAIRLHAQLERLAGPFAPRPWPDPQRAALGAPGPGRIVRRKAFHLVAGLPCQAAAAMDAMDYDIHLFTDADTGEDAVVYRAGHTGVRLARQYRMHPPAGAARLTVNSRRVPTLTDEEAADRLVTCWLPYLFYTCARAGRGRVLYRRYDGDLGLLLPAAR